MKKLASILVAVLFTMMLTVPAFATETVPSVARPNPVVVETLPDPNEPDAPDFVTVEDPEGENEPENYVRVEDPESEDPENPEYEYVPEDQVPLADAAEDGKELVEEGIAGLGAAEPVHTHFGDLTCWLILIVSALVGGVVGVVIGRVSKRKGDEEKTDENAATAAK